MNSDGAMAMPAWCQVLDDEDWTFLKRFLLSSGSLKALAESYGVSYPTLRARLDRLIAKVKAGDSSESRDAFERLLRAALAEGALAAGTARRLLKAHRETLELGTNT